jgi:hypothetical protein
MSIVLELSMAASGSNKISTTTLQQLDDPYTITSIASLVISDTS